MGNAARITAIAERLLSENEFSRAGSAIAITICSWGSGIRFLEKTDLFKERKISLVRLLPYYKSNFKLPFLGSIYFLISLLPVFLLNNFLIFYYCLKNRPRLVLFDSDYHFVFLKLFRLRVKLIFLGQAIDVVSRARQGLGMGLSWLEKLNLLIRERLDGLVQLATCDHILVPSFFEKDSEVSNPPSKVRRIPLIVRKDFNLPREFAPTNELGMCLSGSGIHGKAMRAMAGKLNIPVLEFLPSSAEEMGKYKAMIVQGGLSSISECLALGNYALMVPIPSHAEQKLNCLEVERLGLGRILNPDEPASQIFYSLPQNFCRRWSGCNGADIAVGILKSMI